MPMWYAIHTTSVVLFISIVGFRVAQSYDRGQCEGLEPWERVTDSHVFLCPWRGGSLTKGLLNAMKKVVLTMAVVCLTILTGCGQQQEKKALAEFAKQQNSSAQNIFGEAGFTGATCTFDGKNLVYELSLDDFFFSVVESPGFIDSQKKAFEPELKSGNLSDIGKNLRAVGGKFVCRYKSKSTGKTITMECEP